MTGQIIFGLFALLIVALHFILIRKHDKLQARYEDCMEELDNTRAELVKSQDATALWAIKFNELEGMLTPTENIPFSEPIHQCECGADMRETKCYWICDNPACDIKRIRKEVI